MSGLVKSVGKVFKKVAKSKIVKGLALAAAVYFTAGIAGGAMGSTTMANLPGIQGAADFLGMGDVGAFAGAPPTVTPLADTSAPPPTPTPDATTELQQASAPQASVVDKSVPAGPAAPSPAAGAPKLPGSAGTGVNPASAWFSSLSPAAQQILAQSVAGGAAGMMQALSAKNAAEDAEAREERAREDRRRRGSVPDFSSGIIDRVRGG